MLLDGENMVDRDSTFDSDSYVVKNDYAVLHHLDLIYPVPKN